MYVSALGMFSTPALSAGEQTWARDGQGLAARPRHCPRACQQQAVCRPRSGMSTALRVPYVAAQSCLQRHLACMPACLLVLDLCFFLQKMISYTLLRQDSLQSFYCTPLRPFARLPTGAGSLRPCWPLERCFAQHSPRARQRCCRLATAWRVAASAAASDSPESPTRGSARRAPPGVELEYSRPCGDPVH